MRIREWITVQLYDLFLINTVYFVHGATIALNSSFSSICQTQRLLSQGLCSFKATIEKCHYKSAISLRPVAGLQQTLASSHRGPIANVLGLRGRSSFPIPAQPSSTFCKIDKFHKRARLACFDRHWCVLCVGRLQKGREFFFFFFKGGCPKSQGQHNAHSANSMLHGGIP